MLTPSIGIEIHRCPRCQRPHQIPVSRKGASVVDRLKAIGWQQAQDGLVCGHCAGLPVCPYRHEFATARVPWMQESAGVELCTVCGLVRVRAVQTA